MSERGSLWDTTTGERRPLSGEPVSTPADEMRTSSAGYEAHEPPPVPESTGDVDEGRSDQDRRDGWEPVEENMVRGRPARPALMPKPGFWDFSPNLLALTVAIVAILIAIWSRSTLDKHESMLAMQAGGIELGQQMIASDRKAIEGVNEALTVLDVRMTTVDDPKKGTIKLISNRLLNLDSSVGFIEERVGKIDGRIGSLNKKLFGDNGVIPAVRADVLADFGRIKSLDTVVAGLKGRLDRHASQIMSTTSSAARAIESIEDRKIRLTPAELDAIRQKLGKVTEPSIPEAGRKWVQAHIDSEVERIYLSQDHTGEELKRMPVAIRSF